MGTLETDAITGAPDSTSSEIVSWIQQKIKSGQYIALLNWLKNFEFQSSGDDIAQDLRDSAIQLCQICQYHQEEMDVSWNAYQRSVAQEKALSENLRQLLDLFLKQHSQNKALNTPLAKQEKRPLMMPPAPQKSTPPKFWQKIQGYIGLNKEYKTPYAISDHHETEKIQREAFDKQSEIAPILTAYCLGTFKTYINDKPIENWNGNKGKAVLKYLLAHREHPIPLEVLMDTFWRDDEPESARRNLYQAIYLLRQALQQEDEDFPYVLSQNGTYTLNPDLNVWLDFEAFMMYYENGRYLQNNNKIQDAIPFYETADNLYSGDFLIEDPYNEWPQPKREHLKQTHLHILDCLSYYHYNQKNWTLCLTYFQRILSTDNCREDAHRGLMRVYYFQNQRHLALRQYHQCVEILKQELDVAPMPETTNLHQQIQKNQLHFSPTAKMNPD